LTTLIVHHDDCLRHDPGPRHPEQPRRVSAVLAGLEGLHRLERLPAPLATAEQVGGAHPLEYLDSLTTAEPATDRVALDGDTFMNRGSLDATLRGSGAVCFAIDQLMKGRARNAFCVTRPPGHHAEAATAMGFCLLNQVAVGARHALSLDEISRVAIVDFDVHHGNGTQEIFAASADVLYVSSHQMPLYPGSGHIDETGCGNTLNMPLEPGSGSQAFRRSWSSLGLPALHSFRPDLILVSAGFDAHERDPLAQIMLQDSDFEWITRELVEYAAEACADRLISTLEGGYDLQALASSARAHVTAMTGG
jgi:acetoin utilization deacetylase AcuC-like enzyme